jgi:hypothetical protein
MEGTYRFWSGSWVSDEGREEPIVGFWMRVNVVIALREEKRLSGSCVMEVASMWRLESIVRLENEEGSAPATNMLDRVNDEMWGHTWNAITTDDLQRLETSECTEFVG